MVEEKLKQFAEESGVLTGYRVWTFPELISTLAKDFPIKKRQISSIGELLLIKDAVLSVSAEPVSTRLSPIRDSSVFFRAVNKFIRELRQALVCSKDFEKAVRCIDNEKYHILARIYSHYENRLKFLNLTDDIGRQREILAGLEGYKGIPQSLSDTENLVIEGFYDLLPIQRRIVKVLIDKGIIPEIIPVYSLENPDATKAAEDLLNFFETMENLSPESIIFKPADSGNEENSINALIHNLFKIDKSNAHITDDTVNLIAGPGRYIEIEAVGRKIRRLLKDGVNPSEIGVIFRDIATYEEIVEDVFKRFNIPLYFRRGRNLLALPVVKNIMSIYDIIESNFERERVLKLLNSSYVGISQITGGNGIKFKEVERIVSEVKVVDEDTERWDKAFERYLKSVGIKDRKDGTKVDIETLLTTKNLILNFIAILKGIDKRQPFIGHRDNLYTVIRKLDIEKRCSQQMRQQDIQALDILMDTILEIEKMLLLTGKDKSLLSISEFFSLVREALAEKYLPAYKNKGGIKALSILDARGIRFKHLFVCGLNDGEFPASETTHLFIRDDDKKILNNALGRRIFLTNRTEWWKEPLLFILAISMAEERLCLTYSYLDETGRELLPSIFFRETRRILNIDTAADTALFKKIPVSEVIVNTEDALEKEELAVSLLKSLNLPHHNPDREYAEEVIELIGEGNGFKSNILRLKKICNIERLRSDKQGRADNWTGCITDIGLKSRLNEELLGNKSVWTTTMLETIAKCPFSFYMKDILKLIESEEMDVEINHLAAGTIIHRMLERFYKTAGQNGVLPLTGIEVESLLLNETISLVFKETLDTDFTGSKGLWEIKKHQIVNILKRFYDSEVKNHDRNFIPEYFEIEFGRNKNIPLLDIVLPDGVFVHIKGKIDRIDRCDKALRVIDYKMGSLPAKDEIGKIYFQLPIYILAAARYFNVNPSQCSGLYYSLKDNEGGDIKTIKTDNGSIPLDNYLSSLHGTEDKTLAKDIDRLVSLIKSGNFKAEPYNDRVCLYCRFKNICRCQNI